MLVVQVRVGGCWPTVRGPSRPDIVIPVNMNLVKLILQNTIHDLPTATTSLSSDPKSLVTLQVYVPATPPVTVSLTVSTLEYVDEGLSVTV